MQKIIKYAGYLAIGTVLGGIIVAVADHRASGLNLNEPDSHDGDAATVKKLYAEANAQDADRHSGTNTITGNPEEVVYPAGGVSYYVLVRTSEKLHQT